LGRRPRGRGCGGGPLRRQSRVSDHGLIMFFQGREHAASLSGNSFRSQ
jgi:hypothetical protein